MTACDSVIVRLAEVALHLLGSLRESDNSDFQNSGQALTHLGELMTAKYRVLGIQNVLLAKYVLGRFITNALLPLSASGS